MGTIVDTSTLISLAKIGVLEILKKLKGHLSVPDSVYEEAVTVGEEKGLADATVIKNFISNHNIKVFTVKQDSINRLRQITNKTLTKGDEAVIALAIQESAKEVITNDDGLGRIAMSMGYKVIASPDLLFAGLKSGLIDYKNYESFLKNLVIENRITSAIAEIYIMEGGICQRLKSL